MFQEVLTLFYRVKLDPVKHWVKVAVSNQMTRSMLELAFPLLVLLLLSCYPA